MKPRHAFEVAVFSCVAGSVFSLVVLVLHIESLKCQKYAELNNVKYEYSVLSGCMVQNRSGAWLPLKLIRGIE